MMTGHNGGSCLAAFTLYTLCLTIFVNFYVENESEVKIHSSKEQSSTFEWKHKKQGNDPIKNAKGDILQNVKNYTENAMMKKKHLQLVSRNNEKMNNLADINF